MTTIKLTYPSPHMVAIVCVCVCVCVCVYVCGETTWNIYSENFECRIYNYQEFLPAVSSSHCTVHLVSRIHSFYNWKLVPFDQHLSIFPSLQSLVTNTYSVTMILTVLDNAY